MCRLYKCVLFSQFTVIWSRLNTCTWAISNCVSYPHSELSYATVVPRISVHFDMHYIYHMNCVRRIGSGVFPLNFCELCNLIAKITINFRPEFHELERSEEYCSTSIFRNTWKSNSHIATEKFAKRILSSP